MINTKDYILLIITCSVIGFGCSSNEPQNKVVIAPETPEVSNNPEISNNPEKQTSKTTIVMATDADNKILNKQNEIKSPILEDTNSNQTSAKHKGKEVSPYSNYIRVKTVYELAMESNPSMFFPHDEFETVEEYKKRVSGQVDLMKDIVQMTTQKSEIKRAKRLEVAKEKVLKRKAVVETLMAESSSQVNFTPNDIGRYNAENETFPIILHDTQYQIFVPREEARTFKSNFQRVKIKGLKQLKPKYDIEIKVPKAHVRSRPNGSIIGIASNLDQFEHVQDVDEWYKINFRGQFGFTHKNNANLKLVDIANEYEFHDLVAIHPNTGSIYAMISVDKLVKAPLNLASRKYEAGQPDGPKEY